MIRILDSMYSFFIYDIINLKTEIIDILATKMFYF
jgi:hypothetical protein